MDGPLLKQRISLSQTPILKLAKRKITVDAVLGFVKSLTLNLSSSDPNLTLALELVKSL